MFLSLTSFFLILNNKASFRSLSRKSTFHFVIVLYISVYYEVGSTFNNNTVYTY